MTVFGLGDLAFMGAVGATIRPPTPGISNHIFGVDAGSAASYPETGTTWADSVGVNNAILTNGPTYDSANNGSLVFDGTNDYALTGNTSFNLSASHTISAFVSPAFASTSTTGRAIFDFSNSGGSLRSYLRWEGPSLGFYWDLAATNGNFAARTSAVPTFGANSWLHVCLVHTYRSGSAYYINGSSVGTAVLNDNTIAHLGVANFPVRLGFGAVNNYYWNGKIAVVNLYNKALSASEVTSEFNFYRSRYGL